MDVDYGALVEKYECLQKYYKDGRFGIVNNEAVVLLNKCILSYYFDVIVPPELVRPNNLFPRVPGRAWYVQFVHDKLLKNVGSTVLLDIGTGAYAIYAILAAHVFKSKVSRILGTDIDDDAIKNARKLIQLNGLAQRIDVKHVKSSSDNMFGHLGDASFAITMCNPPFYSSMEEMEHLRSEKMESKTLVELEGSASELFTLGGELKFVMRMMEDSVTHCHQKVWFTCLISKYSSLQPLINHLGYLKIKDHYVQDYTLGETTRWILLWNFHNWKVDTTGANYKLRKLQTSPTIVLPIHGELQKSLAKIEILINQRTLGKLQTTLENSEQLYIVVEFDCWSRRYRRRKIVPESSPHMFQLRLKKTPELVWLEGYNFAIFQSLHSFITGLYLL